MLCVCVCVLFLCFFFFQAEDGIRDLVRSRGLGDVYKRQPSSQSTDSCEQAPVAGSQMSFVQASSSSQAFSCLQPVASSHVSSVQLSLIHI